MEREGKGNEEGRYGKSREGYKRSGGRKGNAWRRRGNEVVEKGGLKEEGVEKRIHL